jgi:hypothetical protein
MALDERDFTVHNALLDQLEVKLEDAYKASRLPEEATTVAALEDFLGRLRLDTL